MMIDEELLKSFKGKKDLISYLEEHQHENPKFGKALKKYAYEQELVMLQAELVDFQKWIQKKKEKSSHHFRGARCFGKRGKYQAIQGTSQSKGYACGSAQQTYRNRTKSMVFQ